MTVSDGERGSLDAQNRGGFEREIDCLSGPLHSATARSRYGVMPSTGGRVCNVGEDEKGRDVEQLYLRAGGNGAQGDQLVA